MTADGAVRATAETLTAVRTEPDWEVFDHAGAAAFGALVLSAATSETSA